ncbi:hypothetical protein ACQPZZ_32060 [Microbispora sp. CA-135349]|uniref:hypothetical protein n=1 Tax=Microbispora sp. CA-135349 TaxID=3239953 RepID=UPI003D8D5086
MHPPHPIRQRRGNPIPGEHQALGLGQADTGIVRNRRQRQRLRRLPQRGHQHPRRPTPAIACAGPARPGRTLPAKTLPAKTLPAKTLPAKTLPAIIGGTTGATGTTGSGARGTAIGGLTAHGPDANRRVVFHSVVAGERTLRRPQRRIGSQPIPPAVITIIRTMRRNEITVGQIHHTSSRYFENLY